MISMSAASISTSTEEALEPCESTEVSSSLKSFFFFFDFLPFPLASSLEDRNDRGRSLRNVAIFCDERSELEGAKRLTEPLAARPDR